MGLPIFYWVDRLVLAEGCVNVVHCCTNAARFLVECCNHKDHVKIWGWRRMMSKRGRLKGFVKTIHRKMWKPESQGENTKVPVGSQAVHSVPGGKSVEENQKVFSIFLKEHLQVLKKKKYFLSFWKSIMKPTCGSRREGAGEERWRRECRCREPRGRRGGSRRGSWQSIEWGRNKHCLGS